MKKSTFFVLLLLFFSSISFSQSPALSVYFDSDQARLEESEIEKIEQYVQSLKGSLSSYRIFLTAHTDSRGSQRYNDRLSERRGKAVAECLEQAGILPGQLEMHPYGERQPLADNKSLEGRGKNRRVELQFLSPETWNWEEYNKVPEAKFGFDASKGLRFKSPVSGMEIDIPAGSLVYPNGKTVTGRVEVSMREYRDMADYLASEIPMHYSDDRGRFFFNSGGMFELNVSQNGEDLAMAPGKTYTVNFQSTHPLAQASLYKYDEQKGQWDYMPDPAFSPEGGSPAEVAPEVRATTVARDNNQGRTADLRCLPRLIAFTLDQDKAATIRRAALYGRDLAKGKGTIPQWFLDRLRATDQAILLSMDRSDIRLVRRIDTEERFFFEDRNGLFTELDALSGCYFERMADSIGMNGPIRDTTSVNSAFRDPNRKWTQVSLYQIRGAECAIQLGDEHEVITVRARLKRSDEEMINQNFDPEQVIAEYLRMRNERLSGLMENLANWRSFYQCGYLFKENEEWCLDFEDWLQLFKDPNSGMQARFDRLIDRGWAGPDSTISRLLTEYNDLIWKLHAERRKRMAKVTERNSGLNYTLRLSGFGLYNCDQIFRLGNQPAVLFAKYQNAEGERLVPASIRIVDRTTGSLFSIPDLKKMYRLPGRKMDIVLTEFSGACYHLPAESYAQLTFPNHELHTFTMNEVTQQVESPAGWRSLLGL